MHLRTPAHTIPIHFHRKSPPPGCNIQPICGPRMSPNSGFQNTFVQVCRWKEKKKEKTPTMNRINVRELICNSNGQVREAYKTLFSAAALPQVADDDCTLFQMMTIMNPVLSFTGRARETDSSLTCQTADRSRAAFPPRPASTELE